VGTYNVTATFTSTDSNYTNASSAPGTLSIQEVPPLTLIYLPSPATIVYGKGLVGGQLDATATLNNKKIAGAFAYYDDQGNQLLAGSILKVGHGTITATFTPTNTTLYSVQSTTATITITAAPVKVTYKPTVKKLEYPTLLTAASFNATAENKQKAVVAGTFVYTEGAGNTQVAHTDENGNLVLDQTTPLAAGIYPVTVTFSPTDATDYSVATNTATITVTEGVITVTPSATCPATLTYGQALPATCPTATAVDELGNVLTTAGTWTYTDGSVTGPAVTAAEVLSAGNHKIYFAFVPSDPSYKTPNVQKVKVDVAKYAVLSLLTFTPENMSVGGTVGAAQTTSAVSVANNLYNNEVITCAWVFSPAAGTVEHHAKTVTAIATCTPSSPNYLKGSLTKTFTVQ
jgi:hypothetical protein